MRKRFQQRKLVQTKRRLGAAVADTRVATAACVPIHDIRYLARAPAQRAVIDGDSDIRRRSLWVLRVATTARQQQNERRKYGKVF